MQKKKNVIGNQDNNDTINLFCAIGKQEKVSRNSFFCHRENKTKHRAVGFRDRWQQGKTSPKKQFRGRWGQQKKHRETNFAKGGNNKNTSGAKLSRLVETRKTSRGTKFCDRETRLSTGRFRPIGFQFFLLVRRFKDRPSHL